MPRLNEDEVFEDEYSNKFRAFFIGQGTEITYSRDRAAVDLGFQLTKPDSSDLSPIRVWFQLKGKYASTLTKAALAGAPTVAQQVTAEQVRYWYALPEPVYLVLYLEATDEFLLEDVRDLVDREFVGTKGGPAAFLACKPQKWVTLHLRRDALLTDQTIVEMRNHRSMRADGPTWRGRPLGHRYDPLRCELARQEPPVFVHLAEKLLTAHDYRIEERLDAKQLIAPATRGSHELFLSVGTMYQTYEWIFSGSVEFGYGPDTDFREEGQSFSVQGRVAVLVHTEVGGPIVAAPSAHEVLNYLDEHEVDHVLLIVNAPWQLVLGSYRQVLGNYLTAPQDLAAVAYSMLTATSVFFEMHDKVRWNYFNYLWADPTRPQVVLKAP